MTDSCLTNIWILAFAFLVIFPFDVYDLCKKENRTWRDYVQPAITAVVIIAFLACLAFGSASRFDSDALNTGGVSAKRDGLSPINHKIFWLLAAIVYLGGIYELISNKFTRRDILFVCLSTVAILIYVILYNI